MWLSSLSLFLLVLTQRSIGVTDVSLPASNYSAWMASSIISRSQGILTSTNDSSIFLQAGFTQKAFRRLVDQYPGPDSDVYRDYIDTSVSSIVPILLNASRDTTYPLDRFSNGNALLSLEQSKIDENKNKNTSDALTALRQSIDLQPRNPDGGLWYYVYPEWSYLDGMYSLVPFYSLYTLHHSINSTANTTALSDIFHQLDLLWQHCYHNQTGLLVHGYDWSRTAVWVDPNQDTGASPHVWGRSLGWYAMSVVDTLEILDPFVHSHSSDINLYNEWNLLKSRFAQLAYAIANATDPTSGAWWQILDQPGREGNYIESSGSAMFVYALLKGLRLGYLSDHVGIDVNATGIAQDSRSSLTKLATRAYSYIVQNFVVNNGNGTLGYNGTVSVCSLNSTASYDYYVTRPINYNSVLGSGAFVLASLEYEKL